MFHTNGARVGYAECDRNNCMKLSAAMRLMQDASSRHLEALELPVERLFAEGMVFLLNKMCIKIHRMPECAEEVVVGTAPVGIHGVRFLREFTIENLAGERLVSALSLWVLVNPRTHKVLRPANFPYRLELEPSRVEGIVGDIPMPKLLEDGGGKSHSVRIRYSHLDINDHVNNSCYGDFVCDALPYEQLTARGLDTVVIHFQNEARREADVDISARDLGSGEYHIYGAHGDGPCFDAYAKLK